MGHGTPHHPAAAAVRVRAKTRSPAAAPTSAVVVVVAAAAAALSGATPRARAEQRNLRNEVLSYLTSCDTC